MKKIIPYTKEARINAKALRLQMTDSEKKIWDVIRKKQLGIQFHRQFPVLDYILDFYAKEIGLAIEIDGGYHNDIILEDAVRQSRIEELGIRFLRFSNKEVQNDMNRIIKIIKNEIKASL